MLIVLPEVDVMKVGKKGVDEFDGKKVADEVE